VPVLLKTLNQFDLTSEVLFVESLLRFRRGPGHREDLVAETREGVAALAGDAKMIPGFGR
jgi:hypothetical protein